jgi:hypothetical protein
MSSRKIFQMSMALIIRFLSITTCHILFIDLKLSFIPSCQYSCFLVLGPWLLVYSNVNADSNATLFLFQEISIGAGWHIQAPFCEWLNWCCPCRCCNSLLAIPSLCCKINTWIANLCHKKRSHCFTCFLNAMWKSLTAIPCVYGVSFILYFS